MKTLICLSIFLTFPITANSVRASDIYLGLSKNDGNIINNIEYSTNKELRLAEENHKKELIRCLTITKDDREECALKSKVNYNKLLSDINRQKMANLKAVYLNISKICEDD